MFMDTIQASIRRRILPYFCRTEVLLSLLFSPIFMQAFVLQTDPVKVGTSRFFQFGEFLYTISPCPWWNTEHFPEKRIQERQIHVQLFKCGFISSHDGKLVFRFTGRIQETAVASHPCCFKLLTLWNVNENEYICRSPAGIRIWSLLGSSRAEKKHSLHVFLGTFFSR